MLSGGFEGFELGMLHGPCNSLYWGLILKADYICIFKQLLQGGGSTQGLCVEVHGFRASRT